MTKTITLTLALLLVQFAAGAANCDGAGNCYVRAGATGSGNGSNWSNACTGFTGSCDPSTMTRGFTYWVAAGSYGALNLNTPENGTQVITIAAATTASRGPASDWNSGFAGQALFVGDGSTISTGYWTIDGQTRGADWQSGYGFKFQLNNTPNNLNGANLNFPNAISNITLRYIDFLGTNSGVMSSSANGDNALYGAGLTNLYVGYSFLERTGNTQVQLNNCSQTCGNNHTYEYDYFLLNHTCCSASHDEAYSLTASNVVIRYNIFQDIVSTGVITDATAVNPPISNWSIYGNLFFWSEPFASSSAAYLTDGIIAMLGENMSGTFNVYNNTIANMHGNATHPCGSGDVRAAIFGHEPGGTVNVNVYNNLIWNSCQGMPMGPNYPPPSFTGTLNWDYQSYFAGDTNPGDTSPHKQTSTANPFVNSSAYTMAGFALATDTAPGISLPAPYDTDMFNVSRASTGNWDRGAFQRGSAGVTRPSAPTSLTLNVQ